MTVADALAHPTWKMGPKITVDSSTLMNKGLEVIEAHFLFGAGYDQIDVVVHPQSMVHSMVETTDGATIAQLSMPDMRLPIGYALSYPERMATPFGAIDWATLGPPRLRGPRPATFPCLPLAYEAGRQGGTAPACLNAANEVAVEAFLNGRLRWVDIPSVLEDAIERFVASEPRDVGRRAGTPTPRAGPGGRGRCQPERLSVPTHDGPAALAEPIRPGPRRGRPRAGAAGPPRRGEWTSASSRPLWSGSSLSSRPAWWRAVSGALETVLVVLAPDPDDRAARARPFRHGEAAGMKVTEFFVGFGPRVWAVQRGETTYGVKALPLGGYCKIIGMTNAEEVAPADEPRAYRNQPTWRRLSVALAGSFVHFLLALTMLVILFVGPGDIGNFISVPPSNDQSPLYNFAHGKSPAQLAGLQAGDRIVAVNGHRFSSWDGLVDYLRARPGQTGHPHRRQGRAELCDVDRPRQRREGPCGRRQKACIYQADRAPWDRGRPGALWPYRLGRACRDRLSGRLRSRLSAVSAAGSQDVGSY